MLLVLVCLSVYTKITNRNFRRKEATAADHNCFQNSFVQFPLYLLTPGRGKKSERDRLKSREQRRSFEGQTGSREMERKHTRCTRRLLSSHRAIIPAIQSGSTLCLTNNGTRRSPIHTRIECACRKLRKTPQWVRKIALARLLAGEIAANATQETERRRRNKPHTA